MDKEALVLLQKLIVTQEENNKKLNKLESSIEGIKLEQQQSNNKLNNLESNIEGIQLEQQQSNNKLNNLESSIEGIKLEQQQTNNSLNSIEIKLDNALGDLGKIISYDIGDSISTIKNDITEIKDKVCKLENVTKNNCYELANLKIVK